MRTIEGRPARTIHPSGASSSRRESSSRRASLSLHPCPHCASSPRCASHSRRARYHSVHKHVHLNMGKATSLLIWHRRDLAVQACRLLGGWNPYLAWNALRASPPFRSAFMRSLYHSLFFPPRSPKRFVPSRHLCFVRCCRLSSPASARCVSIW